MRIVLLPAALLGLLAGALRVEAARIELVAGTAEAPLHEPFGAEPDRAGNLYIIEMISGNRLLKLDAQGHLTHLAGTGQPGLAGASGPALAAQFNGPHSLAVLSNGDVLVADTWNGCIRYYDAKRGTIGILEGFSIAPKMARSAGPYCIALDLSEAIYVADLTRVHRFDLPGVERHDAAGRLVAPGAKVVAGNGLKGEPSDGAVAAEAPLLDPRAVAADRQGNVYILERNGNALRVVDTAGRIRTVVNGQGKKGATGDGGPALAATMNGPKHICIDRDDSVLIADAENHLIRRYSPKDGTITRVAGTGKSGAAGLGGDPLQCELNRPHGVSVRPETGEIFVTDSYNNRVLKIVP